MRALGLVPAVVLASLLCACGTSSPHADAGRTPLAVATAAASPAAAAPGEATLLGVCDHVQDAFRDGTLDERRQFTAMYTELQGVIDVADRRGARALRPLQRAALAIAEGRPRARDANQRRFDRAYHRLEQTCRAAGSTAWNG